MHVATNGPLSDLKPQVSFHVSQSSTVSGQLIKAVSVGMGWLFSETVSRNEPIFLHTACILSRNTAFFSDYHALSGFLQSGKARENFMLFLEHKKLNHKQKKSALYLN